MNITPRPATETGAIDGFGYVCPRCGMDLTNSLRSSLVLDAALHEEFHAARDERAHEGRVS